MSPETQPVVTPPVAPAVQPKPETKGDAGNALSSDRMLKFMEEQNLFSDKVAEQGTPPPPVTPTPESKAPFKVLKVNGKEIPVATEEEFLALAQKGVDYTQKRQADADWERQLNERDAMIKKIEGPLAILAERAKKGEPLFPGETSQTEENPFGEEETVSDPVAAQKLKAVEEQLQKQKEVTDSYALEKKQREMEMQGLEIDKTFKTTREQHPFDDVTREGDDIKLSDMIFAGYVAALDKREKIKAKFQEGYSPRPITETIKVAVQDFNFFQGKLRGTSAAPASATAEDLQRQRPDLYRAVSEKAVQDYLAERSGQPPIVKPGAGEARSSKPQSRASGDGLMASLEKAMDDPEIIAGLDVLGRDGFDIKKFGLKNN